MAHQVYNWQIDRKMTYWYPQARPRRQWGAVFDTNKCIACQTCSLACKTTWTSGRGQECMFFNNVETKPYGSFPTGWEVRALEMLGRHSWGKDGEYEGKTIFEAAPKGERVLGYEPKDLDWSHVNLGEDECAGLVEGGMHFTMPHLVWFFYLARLCNHCTYPACLAACPRSIIYKRPEDGIVLLDQKQCRGYRECMAACPYKRVFFNVETGVSEKCLGCYPFVEKGEIPQCMRTCIGKIRLHGWVSTPEGAREDNPVDYLVHVRNVALPLFPQFGTEPNVFYVPPLHVPERFLVQMFGPAAPAALRTYRTASEDRTLLGALLIGSSAPEIIHSFKVRRDAAFGFNEKGVEICRVPLKEPVYIRPYHDAKLDVYRHNTT